MDITIIALSIIGIVLFICLGGVVGVYNALVVLRNQVKNAWAQVDVQLKRRYDLIPNLVEVVKGYMQHERGTFEAVTLARNNAMSSVKSNPSERVKAEGELSSVISRLFAVAENYPTLKANENFKSLQEELSSTENKIAFSRQFYNDCVLGYNNKIQMFPSNIIASICNFKLGDFFETKISTEKEAPSVVFAK
jgi:LemA protein